MECAAVVLNICVCTFSAAAEELAVEQRAQLLHRVETSRKAPHLASRHVALAEPDTAQQMRIAIRVLVVKGVQDAAAAARRPESRATRAKARSRREPGGR